MKQIKGDLFEIDCDALCITTNGFVKSNGYAVMGMGCAKQLAQFDIHAPLKLGSAIRTHGNIVQLIDNYGVPVYAFPVKPMRRVAEHATDAVTHMRNKFKHGDVIPGWACVADINIITKSAHELLALANEHGWQKVILPRAGCGAGELSWDDVYPILNDILDDRFYAVTY